MTAPIRFLCEGFTWAWPGPGFRTKSTSPGTRKKGKYEALIVEYKNGIIKCWLISKRWNPSFDTTCTAIDVETSALHKRGSWGRPWRFFCPGSEFDSRGGPKAKRVTTYFLRRGRGCPPERKKESVAPITGCRGRQGGTLSPDEKLRFWTLSWFHTWLSFDIIIEIPWIRVSRTRATDTTTALLPRPLCKRGRPSSN